MSSLSRRALALLASAAVAASLAPVPAGAAPRAPLVGSLSVGHAAFWDGRYVEGYTHLPYLADDPCAEEQCWEYRLRLREAGHRLRVAIDVPMRDDEFRFEVLDPTGSRSGYTSNSNQYNAEVFVGDPRAGIWTIRVWTIDADDSAFRMRAKLEAEPPAPGPRRDLPPNLTVVPPFEFGFVAPANPFNGAYPPDDVNPGLEAAGVAPVSCAADETAEDGAVRCLRFSSGPANVGPGPFHLLLEGGGQVAQRVYRSDGSYFERPAGEHEFHRTHLHTHYKEVLTYRLFKVTDRKRGKLEERGQGVKSGFCPADQLLGRWRRFDQAAAYSTLGNCSTSMGLSTGWGDIYRWQRPGQYVEFFGNEDGLYVLRATADVNEWVLETNERDNDGYALIRVTGDETEVLERGTGRHPWDPRKTVIEDWWERLQPGA